MKRRIVFPPAGFVGFDVRFASLHPEAGVCMGESGRARHPMRTSDKLKLLQHTGDALDLDGI
jgi:hypothetical protein